MCMNEYLRVIIISSSAHNSTYFKELIDQKLIRMDTLFYFFFFLLTILCDNHIIIK